MPKKQTEQKIVELLKTMKQGVSHLEKKFSQDEIEQKLYMFSNLMEAFTSIEDALQRNNKAEKFKEETDELRRSFDMITSSYEENNLGDVRSYFVFSFKKAFDEWFKKVMKEYN